MHLLLDIGDLELGLVEGRDHTLQILDDFLKLFDFFLEDLDVVAGGDDVIGDLVTLCLAGFELRNQPIKRRFGHQ